VYEIALVAPFEFGWFPAEQAAAGGRDVAIHTVNARHDADVSRSGNVGLVVDDADRRVP
jgi:hypothetical protein